MYVNCILKQNFQYDTNIAVKNRGQDQYNRVWQAKDQQGHFKINQHLNPNIWI